MHFHYVTYMANYIDSSLFIITIYLVPVFRWTQANYRKVREIRVQVLVCTFCSPLISFQNDHSNNTRYLILKCFSESKKWKGRCLNVHQASDGPVIFPTRTDWGKVSLSEKKELVQHSYRHSWMFGGNWSEIQFFLFQNWSVFIFSVRTSIDLEGWHNRFNARVWRTGRVSLYMLLIELYKEATGIPLVARILSSSCTRKQQVYL